MPVGVTLRSDARRNRDGLVASARRLFAEHGADVSVEEITRDAGVGMGTLYRHFPTKEDLVVAALEEAFDDYIGLADASLEDPDAWGGIETFLTRGLEMYEANRCLADAAVRLGKGERTQSLRRRLVPKLRVLVARAQEQGTVRNDVRAEDLLMLLRGGAGVIERTPASERYAPERYLAIVREGLRA